MAQITWEDFEKVDIRVGKVLPAGRQGLRLEPISKVPSSRVFRNFPFRQGLAWEAVARVLPRSGYNAGEKENSENPLGYGQFPNSLRCFRLGVAPWLHHRPHALRIGKLASIAAEGTFEMGSRFSKRRAIHLLS